MDLSQYSDDELKAIAGIGRKSAAPDLSSYSDEELASIAGIKPKTSYMQDVVTNFKGGISAAGDIVTGNYQGIGENKITPATQSLADKLFPQGSMGGSAMENIGDTLYNAKTNTGRADYAPALLEKFGESLPGKAVQAIGGVIPTFNLAGTAIQKYANPAISEATGMTEDEVALAELALSPLGLKAGRKAPTGGKTQPPPKPFFSGVPDAAIVKGATYPVTHPLKTAGFVVDTAGKLLSPVSSRVAKTILESDNKTFGGNLANDMASSVASEGARLGNKMGVDFSAGELTGNKAAMGFEDVFANSPSYVEKFAKANELKTSKIIGKFNETLDKINPESASRTDVGFSLGDAYRGTLDSLIKTRREQAKIDFGEAVKGGGGDSTILSNNLFRELNAIADEGNAKLLTKSKSYGAVLARNILKRTSKKLESGNIQAERINLQDMANGLSDFSAEATRPGSIMDNAQSAAERRVYSRLYSALQKDLDAEIAAPKGNPQRAAMLVVARDNYLKHSNQIADINKTALGKVIGQADYNSEGQIVIQPELLADKFSKLQPNELKNTMDFLDKNHPDIAQMGRRFVLEEALRKATEGRGLRGEGTTKEFAKAEFVKNMPDSERLNALLGDKFAAGDVRDIAAAMNRLIDYGAEQKGSQTFGRGEFNKGIGAYMKGMLYRAVTSDSLVDDLMNPQKRRQIVFEANKINKATSYTETPEFKARFEGSKVVDEQGAPLRVYHGTKSEFDTFNTDGVKGGKTEGTGAFFSSSKGVAESYRELPAFYGQEPSGRVLEQHLVIKKPLELDAKGQEWDMLDPMNMEVILANGERDSAFQYVNGKQGRTLSTDDIVAMARNNQGRLSAYDGGYDGVIIRNIADSGKALKNGVPPTSDIYSVFSPDQIIPAFGEGKPLKVTIRPSDKK